MHDGFATTEPWSIDTPNPERDIALAEHAVKYLRGHGLDDVAVVRCLRDEFEIDLDTAERIAVLPGFGPREAAGG